MARSRTSTYHRVSRVHTADMPAKNSGITMALMDDVRIRNRDSSSSSAAASDDHPARSSPPAPFPSGGTTTIGFASVGAALSPRRRACGSGGGEGGGVRSAGLVLAAAVGSVLVGEPTMDWK